MAIDLFSMKWIVAYILDNQTSNILIMYNTKYHELHSKQTMLNVTLSDYAGFAALPSSLSLPRTFTMVKVKTNSRISADMTMWTFAAILT